MVLSIAGAILINYQKRLGFIFWMIANLGWVLIDFYKQIPEQAILFIVYFGLSVWGFFQWGKNQTTKQARS